jgi:hypothetical protein
MSRLTLLKTPHQEWCKICTMFFVCMIRDVNVNWHIMSQFMSHILLISSDVLSCVILYCES